MKYPNKMKSIDMILVKYTQHKFEIKIDTKNVEEHNGLLFTKYNIFILYIYITI